MKILLLQLPLKSFMSWTFIPEIWNLTFTQNLHTNVHRCFIHDSQKLETSHVSFNVLSHFSCVHLCATLWTIGSSCSWDSGQEYWNGLPFPSPGDLPNPGIEPQSPALQVDSLPSEPPGTPIALKEQHRRYTCWWSCSVSLIMRVATSTYTSR